MPLRIELTPYRLPLRRPWRTAHGLMTDRTGWLVRAEADGLSGFGDCAPLPEAGTETAGQAQARLAQWQAQSAAGAAALLAALDTAASPAPAADCAVESALLDLSARDQGLPLRRLLRPDALDRIAINAMLGPAATLATAAVEQAIGAGFRVLKLKVGMASMAIELPRIEAAAALLPAGARLRLDANGAWDEATAAMWIERLAGLPIDSLEEPLAEPEDGALAHLQAQTPFDLALDESLARHPAIAPSSLPVRRLVLKPAALGGLRRTLRLAGQARAAGREVVVTSLVSSAAGLWVEAQLAAATGSSLAHGLATADWLATDVGAPPPVENGMLLLPETPGSGCVATP